MTSRTASRLLAPALVALLVAGAVIYAESRPAARGGVTTATGRGSAAPSRRTTITIERAAVGRPIPAGFVGLATEFRGLEAYAGSDPHALNPVFEQLIRNLAPHQSPVLRIGGDTTDRTWWPLPDTKRPPGVRFDLTRNWLQVARGVAQAVGARLILGLNLELDSSRSVVAESQAMARGIGRSRIAAFELGNEPELYPSFPWYRLPDGRHVRGRPRTYDWGAFLQDFSHMARSVAAGVTLAGPGMGSPVWIPLIGQFMASDPRVALVTLHRYPLKRCSAGKTVTVAEVLSRTASVGLAATVAHAVASARARGVRLRVDEMNAVTCGGMPGVSNSFASALWSLDALFAMARVGVDGVNIQTRPGGFNEVFHMSSVRGAWQADVEPVYYGLMMFAQAAPPGSRLLRIAGGSAGVETWGTRAPDGTVRVVLINDDTAQARHVTVHVTSSSGEGTLVRLLAPSVHAESGVTLGGQGFGSSTTTGLLAGTPLTASAKPVAGGYGVSLPPASAAMLTLPAR